MPNWCSNEVLITGPVEDMAALKALLVSNTLDFNLIIPLPKQLERGDGMVGRTAGSCAVVMNDKTKVFHMAGSCKAKDVSIFDRVDMRKTSNAALAINNGYRPCKVCMVNPNMRGQGFDRPIEEGAALYKEFGADNVLDWAIANWGTKWNPADEAPCDFTDTTMEANFSTAWSPPEPIYNKLCDLFPNLDIKWHYSEPGCDFAGDFDTGEQYEYRCDCGESDCPTCFPDTYDDEID
jgi:hypothetical protein